MSIESLPTLAVDSSIIPVTGEVKCAGLCGADGKSAPVANRLAAHLQSQDGKHTHHSPKSDNNSRVGNDQQQRCESGCSAASHDPHKQAAGSGNGCGSDVGDTAEVNLRDSRCCSHDGYTPHAPSSRPPSSLLATASSASPSVPRRRVSNTAAQADAADPPSPSLVARRMWTHFPERDTLVANPPSVPAERSAEAESVRVTRTRSLTAAVPSKLPFALSAHAARPSLCVGTLSEEKRDPESEPVTKAESGPTATPSAAAKPTDPRAASPDTHSESFQKVQSASSSMLPSPVAQESILLPRSPARPPPPPTCPPSFQLDDETAAAEREASSPSPFRASSSEQQDDSVKSISSHYTIPAELKATPGCLPSFPAAATTWNEERESTVPSGAASAGAASPTATAAPAVLGSLLGSTSSQPLPAALSFTRPRLHPTFPPRRFSRQVSLSFEYAEDDKGAASITNSDSFPPHGLSPSSAVPSDIHTSALPAAPLPSDIFWRGRSARADARSTTSSASSPQRQDLEPLPPPRCASTTLADRQVSPPETLTPHGTHERHGSYGGSFSSNTARRVESASFRPAHPFRDQPPRTRSAAYSASARGVRGARLSRGSADTAALLADTTPFPRSLSSHSTRSGFSPGTVADNGGNSSDKNNNNGICSARAGSGAALSNLAAPLLPRLDPLLHSPSLVPRFPASQPPLTPLHGRTSTSCGGFNGPSSDAAVLSEKGEARTGRSRSLTVDEFDPFPHGVTSLEPSLAQHGHHPPQYRGHGQSALPTIQMTATPPAAAAAATTTASAGATEVPAVANSGHRRSTPRQSRVSFTVPNTPQMGDEDTSATSTVIDGARLVDSSVCSSVPAYSEAAEAEDDPNDSHSDYVSPSPPPPPWTPAEALYWMSGRLTRQEAREMRRYDKVYYCGPAVPPRTACGVTEAAPASPSDADEESDEEGNDHFGQDLAATLAQNTAASPTVPARPFTSQAPAVAAAAAVVPTSPASPVSYFPITLGMHISFRYEVAEVLGFGTFSVVVRAIDHAAPPLSPERHCALKLIRKEALYQRAALDEWAVYEHVKACCASATVDAVHDGAVSSPLLQLHHSQYHRLRPFSSPFRPSSSFSFTSQLTSSDQRTLLVASVLTPRTQFKFRGYHIIAFPLLGFNVRDVLELQRECEETAAAEAQGLREDTQHQQGEQRRGSPMSSSREEETHKSHSVEVSADVSAAPKPLTPFPPLIAASILAQVVHALAFLHHDAHLLHGDLKPENVVFVDRTLSQNILDGSSTHPLYEQHHLLQRNSGSGVGATDGAEGVKAAAAAAYTPATPPISFASLLQPHRKLSSAGAPSTPGASLHSRSVGSPHQREPADPQQQETSSGDAGAARTATQPSRGGEEPDALAIAAAARSLSSSPTNSPTHWLCGCHATSPGTKTQSRTEGGAKCNDDDEGEDGGERPGVDAPPAASRDDVTSPVSRDLHTSGLSILYTPHTPSRHTPGLTASRTGTLPCSPHTHPPQDTLTLDGSSNDHTHRSSVQTPLWLESCGSLLTSACTTSSRVAVIDLGHAKPLAPGQTGVAFPLQSPSYRAPEMALRLPYTTAIDMWSLGCVLYELRTGRVLLPTANDDATTLTAAVAALGMPDTAFLSMVKACWKEYKQRKVSGAGGNALPSRSSSVAVYGTSFSVYLTEQDAAEQERERGSGPALHNNDNNNDDNTSTGAARPVSVLSEEEAAVEKCWRNFIQVLNTTAGQQRTRNELRRRHSTSIYVSANQSTATSPSKPLDGAVIAPSTPAKAEEEEEEPTALSATTWETSAQCALLSHLFPHGEVDVDEQTFVLRVAERYRRPSASAVTAPSPVPTCPENAEAPAKKNTQRLDYAWADFLLGCLYWDAAERLSSVEAQRHPFIAANFVNAANHARKEEAEAEEEEGEGEQDAAAAVSPDVPPHCSGVYYLQHHPLTARLFAATTSTPVASGRRRSSRDGERQECNSSVSALPRRRRSSTALPLLPLASTAILPYELPSNKRTAPSARAWEEHQHLQQQQGSHVAEDGPYQSNGRLTPPEQRVSVFCERPPSPEEGGARGTHQACASVATTTPFRFDLNDSEERVSSCDVDLLSPNRIIEMEEGDKENSLGTAEQLQLQSQESEVMVLRLD